MDADLRRLFSRDELHERARDTVTDEYGFQSISSVIEADDHICVYLRPSVVRLFLCSLHLDA
jgi:hypothetical protein